MVYGKCLLLILGVFTLSHVSNGQDKCGTDVKGTQTRNAISLAPLTMQPNVCTYHISINQVCSRGEVGVSLQACDHFVAPYVRLNSFTSGDVIRHPEGCKRLGIVRATVYCNVNK